MKNKQFLFFSVFKRYISLVRQNEALCGNGLNNVACSPIQSVISIFDIHVTTMVTDFVVRLYWNIFFYA